MKTILISLSVFLIASSTAYGWDRIEIPGAICGSGLPYSVFIEKKSDNKLLVEFMGGGACWNLSTCYGPDLKTWMYPVPKSPYYSLVSLSNALNPMSDHTKVYFPYCTGDVHVGQHTEEFALGIKAHQVGYSNVQKAWKYLGDKGYVKYSQLDEVVMWGASAGAIGAIAHTATLNPYLKPGTKKMLLADSPGLHFGSTFWDKFDDAMLVDFKNAFGKVGIDIKRGDGMIAAQLGKTFQLLSDWKIAILQSTRDPIMSEEFGEISQDDFEKLVLGPDGLPAVASQFSNVKTFIPHISQHTFLLLPDTAELKDPSGQTAWDFVLRSYFEFLDSVVPSYNNDIKNLLL